MREPFSWSHWGTLALNGVRAAIDPTWLPGGRTLATTALDLITRPETLRRGEGSEFEQRTGGGIGGERWVAPLLPKDFEPPVDLPWPEYVETRCAATNGCLPTPTGFGERLG